VKVKFYLIFETPSTGIWFQKHLSADSQNIEKDCLLGTTLYFYLIKRTINVCK